VNLVDTSVWIEVLRGTKSTGVARFRDLVAQDPLSVAVSEPIIMELIAGAVGERGLAAVERLGSSSALLSVDPARDFQNAGHVCRAARARGLTVRNLADCLIATVAIRYDATLWHRDADFEALATIAPLSTVDLR
jgi:predicted nucleic acid-binding protein